MQQMGDLGVVLVVGGDQFLGDFVVVVDDCQYVVEVFGQFGFQFSVFEDEIEYLWQVVVDCFEIVFEGQIVGYVEFVDVCCIVVVVEIFEQQCVVQFLQFVVGQIDLLFDIYVDLVIVNIMFFWLVFGDIECMVEC